MPEKVQTLLLLEGGHKTVVKGSANQITTRLSLTQKDGLDWAEFENSVDDKVLIRPEDIISIVVISR